jgi:hypothetical protein
VSATRESGWAPDPTLVNHATKTIEAVIADSSQDLTDQVAIEAVAAFGLLTRMGQHESAQAMAAHLPSAAALAERALAGFDFVGLEAAAFAFAESAPDLADGDEAAKQARPRVLAALTTRDRAEQVLKGAEVLLGRAPVLDDEQQSLLMEFDSLVQPELFRAVPLNDERTQAISGIAPDQRAGLWWYTQGVGLPPDALDALATTAELITRFPEAAEELRQLIEAEETIVGRARSTEPLAQPLVLGEMGGQRTACGQVKAPLEGQQPALRVLTPGTDGGSGSHRP